MEEPNEEWIARALNEDIVTDSMTDDPELYSKAASGDKTVKNSLIYKTVDSIKRKTDCDVY